MQQNSPKNPHAHLNVKQLEGNREQLLLKCGQHQFTKAFIEAEMLDWNQQVLSINNELARRRDEARVAAENAPPAPVIEDLKAEAAQMVEVNV